MIDAYFTRPGEYNEIHNKLIDDIKKCKVRLLVSVAYISDDELVKEIVKKENIDKRIILNSPDYFRKNSLAPLISGKCNCVSLGTWESETSQSNMHHKFIICDDVLWIGSYNLTNYAKYNNWENMIRIKKENIIDKFLLEFEYMWIVGEAINRYINKSICRICGKRIYDPISHFNVIVNAGEPTWNGFPSYDVFCNEDEHKPYETCCDICGKSIMSNNAIISNTTSYLVVYCIDCAYKKLWTENKEAEEYFNRLENY